MTLQKVDLEFVYNHLPMLAKFLEEISRSKNPEPIMIISADTDSITENGAGQVRVEFFTENNKYVLKSDVDGSLLGCRVHARKTRPGESSSGWYRDLPADKLNEKTWSRIKNAIIQYELKNLIPQKVVKDWSPSDWGPRVYKPQI